MLLRRTPGTMPIGVPTFKVKLGAHKGNLALQIIDPIERR